MPGRQVFILPKHLHSSTNSLWQGESRSQQNLLLQSNQTWQPRDCCNQSTQESTMRCHDHVKKKVTMF